jgi:hypothetical protein
MHTGNGIVDRGVSKLLSEGFNVQSINRSNPAEKKILMVNRQTGEGASITFGNRQVPKLERGPIDAEAPDVKMPVATYLKHWSP